MSTNNSINTNSPVYFNAYLSVTQTNTTGAGTAYPVIFDTVINQNGTDYDDTTGIFTAPVTGNYLFTSTVAYSGAIAEIAFGINLTGNAYGNLVSEVGVANAFGNQIMNSSTIVPMTAGDTIGIVAYGFGGTDTLSILGGAPSSGLSVTSTFSGILL